MMTGDTPILSYHQMRSAKAQMISKRPASNQSALGTWTTKMARMPRPPCTARWLEATYNWSNYSTLPGPQPRLGEECLKFWSLFYSMCLMKLKWQWKNHEGKTKYIKMVIKDLPLSHFPSMNVFLNLKWEFPEMGVPQSSSILDRDFSIVNL